MSKYLNGVYFNIDMFVVSLIIHNDMQHLWYGKYDIRVLFSMLALIHANFDDRLTVVHYGDVIMGAIASHITNLTIVYSIVYSDADQRKHQSSTSLAFVWGVHREPVHSPHKWPITRKMFPFDDVM